MNWRTRQRPDIGTSRQHASLAHYQLKNLATGPLPDFLSNGLTVRRSSIPDSNTEALFAASNDGGHPQHKDKDIMKDQMQMTDMQRLIGLTAICAAIEWLCRNGFLEFDINYDVRLTVKPSHAFRMAVSPTTDALEAIMLCNALTCLMMEKGLDDLMFDLDRAIFHSLQGCRLAAVPWPLLELPQFEPEPELAASVLKRLRALESEGWI